MVSVLQMDRYLAAMIAMATGVVLVCLLALVTLFTVVDELSDITPGYTDAEALRYVFYSTPRRLYELTPYGVFIGTLIGLGVLASHSELTVLRSVGVSLARLFGGTAIPVLAILGANLLLGEFVAPAGEHEASTRKLSIQHGSAAAAIDSRTWHREGGTFTSVDGYGPTGDLIGIRQFVVRDGRLRLARRADRAVFLPHVGYWRLEDVVETHFLGTKTESRRHDIVVWESRATRDALSAKALFDPAKLSLRDLASRIRYAQGEDATRYRVAFWAKVFQPAAVLGLVLLALAFVVGPLRETGLGARLAIGIAVGLAFKYLIDLFGPMSVVFGIPPWLAMLVPVIACWLAGVGLIRRA